MARGPDLPLWRSTSLRRVHCKTQSWLSRQFGEHLGEWAYGQIKRPLFTEELIEDNTGKAPVEYKIHACEGKTIWDTKANNPLAKRIF